MKTTLNEVTCIGRLFQQLTKVHHKDNGEKKDPETRNPKAVWKVDMVSLREGCIWRPGQDVQLEEGRQVWTCCWDQAVGDSRNAGHAGHHRRAGAGGFKPHWQQLVFLKPYDHLSPSQRRTRVWRCHSGSLVLVSLLILQVWGLTFSTITMQTI